MVESSPIGPLVLFINTVKVQVRAEARDDSWKSAKIHLESFKPCRLDPLEAQASLRLRVAEG